MHLRHLTYQTSELSPAPQMYSEHDITGTDATKEYLNTLKSTDPRQEATVILQILPHLKVPKTLI